MTGKVLKREMEWIKSYTVITKNNNVIYFAPTQTRISKLTFTIPRQATCVLQKEFKKQYSEFPLSRAVISPVHFDIF